MSETLNYIDDYFSNRLSTTDKAVFENKIEADPVFAEEVAFFITTRDSIKQQLHQQKKQQFDELYSELKGTKRPVISIYRKAVPYLAAAVLIIGIVLVYLLKTPSPQSLADNYISANLGSLSTTMGSADDLQRGVAAYNQKDFATAEQVFKSLVSKPDVGPKALEDLGLVYLQTKRYDDALQQFTRLKNYPGLYANTGTFYQAIVLMKRSEAGDHDMAKKLLQEVVTKDLPGAAEAKQWLDKLQ